MMATRFPTYPQVRGGGQGIRTLDGCNPIAVFKSEFVLFSTAGLRILSLGAAVTDW